MRLDGIHHVTNITGDAPTNVDFYAGTLGLRLVKKSVNQDDPTVYHLFYADEQGTPGSDITFFEYPGAAPGRAGAGMIHTIAWRVGSAEALDFWAEPLIADHPEIPRELALQGFEGVRAYASNAERQTAPFLEQLGFEREGERWDTRGDARGGWIEYEPAPEEPGIPGAGTVHHVAWSSTMDEHQAWQKRVAEAGGRPTPVIDRFWFRSIYFREPSGVLFEIATLGPGFSSNEDPEHLGEKLILTPLPNPREKAKA